MCYFKFYQCSTTLKYKVKYMRWAPSFSTLSSDTYVYTCLIDNVIDILFNFKDYKFGTKYNR